MSFQKFADSEMMDDKDSIASDAMMSSGYPVYQQLLMDFLHEDAPVLGKKIFFFSIQLYCNITLHIQDKILFMILI